MNKQNHIRQDVIWNAAGSLIYALASMVLAFSVIRLAGPRDGGIFGFGFSTLGQQMFIIAYFGIRPFHITDMKKEYSFGDYPPGNGDAHRCWQPRLPFSLSLSCISLDSMRTTRHGYCFFYVCIKSSTDMWMSMNQSCKRQDLLYRTGQSLAFRSNRVCSSADDHISAYT
jgi:hypothetical protein